MPGFDRRFPKAFWRDPAAQNSNDKRGQCTGGASLNRRQPARINAAKNDADQQHQWRGLIEYLKIAKRNVFGAIDVIAKIGRA